MKLFIRQSLMAVAVLMGSTGMMKAADGDTFTAKSTEGLQLTFKVISESVKTCQLGDGVDICIFEPYASSTREIKTLTIPDTPNGYKVTTIGRKALYDVQWLTRIVIPQTVTVLADKAFCISYGNYDNLEEMILPDGLTTIGERCFSNRVKWPLTAIPSGVTSIGEGAFYYCESITVNSLPNSITTVPNGLFNGCKSITSFNLHEGITAIGNYAFEYSTFTTIKLPSTLREIGENAFRESALTGIVLPEGLTTIGRFAFAYSENLASITFPSTLTTIGDCAASYLPALRSVTLPDAMTTIPGSLFEQSGLESITLPKNLTTIGESAFKQCKQLKTVTWNAKLATICSSAFCDCEQLEISTIPASVRTIENGAFSGCHAITTITLPATVEDYDANILSYCTGLISATLANGIKTVPYGLFSGCKNLKTVNLPASIEVIERYAFYNCSAFETLTMPQNLTTIRMSAFSRSGLKNITWNSAIRTIEYDAFSQCPFTEITLPGCITELPNGLFSGCPNLTTVTLAEGFTEVPGSFFEGCQKLTTVNLPSTITSIGQYAFAGTTSLTQFTIPEGCTEVGMLAFSQSGVKKIWVPSTLKKAEDAFKNSAIEEVVLAENITSIQGLFQNMTTLKSVHLPASVTVMGGAFVGCPAIEQITVDNNNKVYDSRENCNGVIETATNTLVLACATTTIPTSVMAIGDNAYNSVQGISDFVVPQQIKKIGYQAFYASSLTSITFPDGLEMLGGRALGSTNITEYIQPKTINKVPQSIVANCKKLTTVTLHDHIESIEDHAFSSTSALKTLTLPTSVLYIREGAFSSSGIEDLTIPGTVQRVDKNCFYECRKINHLIIEGGPKLSFGEKAFYQTWINHLSFLTSSLALNGCGRTAFYPSMITYQAYYDESIRRSFAADTRTVFDPFIGIMDGEEWTPIICTTGNFQLPEGLEAYIITGIQNGKALMQQVQSINKNQPVMLRLKDPTKATVINMASGKLLRFETKMLSDSEVTPYEGSSDFGATVGYYHLYSDYNEYKDKTLFFFKDGQFVKTEDDTVTGLSAFFALDPEVAGSMTTIVMGDDKPGVKGDADGNGTVGPEDVTVIQNLILNGRYSSQADVNGDHKVDVADIVALINIINKSKSNH